MVYLFAEIFSLNITLYKMFIEAIAIDYVECGLKFEVVFMICMQFEVVMDSSACRVKLSLL